jgi:hypothetical protein
MLIKLVGPGSRAALAMMVALLVKPVYRIAMGSRCHPCKLAQRRDEELPTAARAGESASIGCLNEPVKFFD